MLMSRVVVVVCPCHFSGLPDSHLFTYDSPQTHHARRTHVPTPFAHEKLCYDKRCAWPSSGTQFCSRSLRHNSALRANVTQTATAQTRTV